MLAAVFDGNILPAWVHPCDGRSDQRPGGTDSQLRPYTPRGYTVSSGSVRVREVTGLATDKKRRASPPRAAWHAWAATFALAVAIIGGLLAMHTLSVDHTMGSPAHSMTHHAHATDAVFVGGDGDSVSPSSPATMSMLACILALLSITALVAAVAPAKNRALAPPVTHTVGGPTSPGWSFSLPPPSLTLLSISRV